MEVAAAGFGLVEGAARVCSQAWRLTNLWTEAPHELHQLRDSLERTATFFKLVPPCLEEVSRVEPGELRLQLMAEAEGLCTHGKGVIEGIGQLLRTIEKPPLNGTPLQGLPKRRRHIWMLRKQEAQRLHQELLQTKSDLSNLLMILNLSVFSRYPCWPVWSG